MTRAARRAKLWVPPEVPSDAMTDLQTLTARYVFPVTAAPIRQGMVTLQQQRIAAVGRHPAGGERLDLGNVAIVPGLINAHVHLELSDLNQPLGNPGIEFVDWLREVVAHRRQAGPTRQAIERGLRESVQHGVTALGDIVQPGWQRDAPQYARVDATIFLELIGPTAARAGAALQRARQHLQDPGASTAWRAGLSPHAPYSVRQASIAAAASLSAAARVPVAFHLAESREELELLRSGTGPLRPFLENLGAWEPSEWSSRRRPLDFLRILSDAYRVLVIHGNYLDDEEIAFLGQHAQRMAVIYCPRTHAWFGHADYPLEKLLSAGATVALGTDSRASSPDLSLLAEMQAVAARHPALGRDTILRLGTIHGARALGIDCQTGSLEPGKRADLTLIALPDREADDPHELLFDPAAKVVGRYFRACWLANSSM